jgi:pyruvate kinase
MDVARVNLTHQRDEQTRDRLVAAVREAADGAGRAVGVMADLSGPKVRLGELEGEEVHLQEGGTFVLWPEGGPGDATGAPTSHPGLGADVQPGDRVLLSDGAVELRVAEAGDGEVTTEVVKGGTIRSRAGVNVPADRLRLPAITEQDERDLEWIRSSEVDLVAQSFVRRAEEVRALADLLRDDPAILVAKIETGPAVEDIDRILEAADAVMIARGDLGVELPRERIPVVQKHLVDRANREGVPAVVATEMLESMKASPRPTRAEAGDVAGAAFDGAAAVLLSAETAIGGYPVEAARTAATILRTAETEGQRFMTAAREETHEGSEASAIAHAAGAAVGECGAEAVACFTRTGRTGRLLSGVRLRVPVYAFSHDERVVRRLTIFGGVRPMRSDPPEDTDAMIAMMDRRLREEGVVRDGALVIMVASSPVGEARTNLLKVHRVGS